MSEPNDATVEENMRLRARVENLERREVMYREMAREASSTLMRVLRGEPFEGWINPQPVPGAESEKKLLARLHQAKQVSHSRYEELTRIHADYARRMEEARQAGWKSGYLTGKTEIRAGAEF